MSGVYGGTPLDSDKPQPQPQAYRLRRELFVEAEKKCPDLMEPWSTLVGATDDPAEQHAIMREALGAIGIEHRIPEFKIHVIEKSNDEL